MPLQCLNLRLYLSHLLGHQISNKAKFSAKKKLAKNLTQSSQPGSPAVNSPNSSGLNSPQATGQTTEMARVAEIKKLIDEQAKDRSRSRSHGASTRDKDRNREHEF